jgi:hypothetical protein
LTFLVTYRYKGLALEKELNNLPKRDSSTYDFLDPFDAFDALEI